ncbi:fructose-bisphosphate aldolase [Candidatus Bipolaricaulota bacterium]|nr:fructose-bisphosphate aldolase [Candidatus Bipolaricaulota bacterium]
MTGLAIRLRRVFRDDNRSVVVALDHAQFQGSLPGLESMADIVGRVVAGGADAVILNPGAVRDCVPAFAGRCGLIVRLTGASSRLNPSFDYHRKICSVRQAVSLGADAVIAMGFVGGAGEPASLALLAHLADQCHCLGVPLIAEMLPVAQDHFHDPDWIGVAARTGYELGADVIKAYTTGTAADRKIIEQCSVPFLAAGGAKTANPIEIATQAMAHGAAGIAFGRNVFGADDPTRVVRDLVREVHGG